MKSTLAIAMQDVSFTHTDASQPVLKHLNLNIKQGEWVWVVGAGGAGKSTLCGLVNGLLVTSEAGIFQGEMQLHGVPVSEFVNEQAGLVGAVFQNPETGLVMEYVEDELAFGPENLRVPVEQIETRIDQALLHVGMEGTRMRRTAELSGGQQQRISIASMLTMHPQLLVLDNALANLDQPAVEQVMLTLKELHQRGHTIIMTTSRLDEQMVQTGDRLLILDQGSLVAEGEIHSTLSRYKERLIQLGCWPAEKPAVSAASALSHSIPASNRFEQDRQSSGSSIDSQPLLRIDNLTFRYESKRTKGEQSTPVLDRIHMELDRGEIVALLGPNGSGKTTLGKLIAGLLTAPANQMLLNGADLASIPLGQLSQFIGYIFQNPEHQFVADTVMEECIFGLRVNQGLPPWGKVNPDLLKPLLRKGEEVLQRFDLLSERDTHPQQLHLVDKRMLNLASAMILEPKLIILDEPTAGLDYHSTDRLLSRCAEFAAQGGAVLLITHDQYAVNKWATRTVTLQ